MAKISFKTGKVSFLGTSKLRSSVSGESLPQSTTPSITFVSKNYTSITWRYTNNDATTATIYVRLDSGSYINLGTVVSSGTTDYTFNDLTHNTAYTSTAYAAGTGKSNSTETTSASITTLQYKVTNPALYDVTGITATSITVSFENKASYTVSLVIGINSGNWQTKTNIVSGATASHTFSSLTASTSYTLSCYATYSGYINSDTISTTRTTSTAGFTTIFNYVFDGSAVDYILTSSNSYTTLRVESYNNSDVTIDYYEYSVTSTRQSVSTTGPGMVESGMHLYYGNNSELFSGGVHGGQYGSISFALDGDWGIYNSDNGYKGIRLRAE